MRNVSENRAALQFEGKEEKSMINGESRRQTREWYLINVNAEIICFPCFDTIASNIYVESGRRLHSEYFGCGDNDHDSLIL